jgi:hypothetical protein
MLSRYAIKNINKLEDDMGQIGHIYTSRSWQPQARQSVIRQLLEARLDLDEPVNPQGQHRALTIALKLEFWRAYCIYPLCALLQSTVTNKIEQILECLSQLDIRKWGGEDLSAADKVGGTSPRRDLWRHSSFLKILAIESTWCDA